MTTHGYDRREDGPLLRVSRLCDHQTEWPREFSLTYAIIKRNGQENLSQFFG